MIHCSGFLWHNWKLLWKSSHSGINYTLVLLARELFTLLFFDLL